GPFEAPVAGVVVDYVSPRGSVILARPAYQRWWADRSVNRFHVTLAPGAALEAVRHAIATDMGADLGLKVLTQRELYAYHQDAVRRAFRLTDALEILPLVVAALGLAEALLAVSLDRRHEFALLRAGGAAAGAGGAARGVVERGAADVLHGGTVWRSVPFVLVLAACGGVRLEDRTTAPALPASVLEVVADLDYPPGNIAVSPTGRVFFTLHPSGDPPIKLVELVGGKPVPYPDEASQQTRFDSPLAVRIDRQGRLWTLDFARYGRGQPRLLAFDLASNTVVHQYDFPSSVAGFLS